MDEDVADIEVPPFTQPELLELIRDAEAVEQDLLEEAPLAAVFDYARLQTDTALRALGREELDPARQGEILADRRRAPRPPARSRPDRRPPAPARRRRGMRNDWIGTLQTLDSQYIHFLVAGARGHDGQRRVDISDYLRVDGLFHCVYRAAVEKPSPLRSCSARISCPRRRR